MQATVRVCLFIFVCMFTNHNTAAIGEVVEQQLQLGFQIACLGMEIGDTSTGVTLQLC